MKLLLWGNEMCRRPHKEIIIVRQPHYFEMLITNIHYINQVVTPSIYRQSIGDF